MPKSTTLICGPVSLSEVFSAIERERAYQDAIWCAATTPTEGKHTPTEFLVYMQHYMNLATVQASTAADPVATIGVLDNLRKVVALGAACMEQNGVVHRDPAQFPKVS